MLKKLTGLNFFPAFSPPKSGGELRYYHIYKNLGDYYDVTMISPTHPGVEPELVNLSEHVKEYRVPKGSIHIKLHQFFDKYGKFPECSAVVVAIASHFQDNFKHIFNDYASSSEIIVREFPFLLTIPKKDKKQIWIYNSYNVEYDLQRGMLNGWLGRLLSIYIWYSERKICRLSDIIFATSEQDMERFLKLYGINSNKIFSAPNGVDTANLKFFLREEKIKAKTELGYQDRPCLLFIGSLHPPNIEAVEYIVKKLAIELSDCLFVIAGKVCDCFKGKSISSNVSLLGLVSEEQKELLLAGCDLALNPMFSGSGTNLKMLDYMAVGLPIITTPIGARGLGIKNGQHAIISEAIEFADSIKKILNDYNLYEKLRANSRNLVEQKYDWKSIVAEMHKRIEAVNENNRY